MGSSVRKNGSNRDSPGCRTAGATATDATLTAAPAAESAAKASKDTLWDRRIRIASCVSFLMGCAWILLFPLVTVTTGETKPRGTFFDENALLVHHTSTKLTATDVDWTEPSRLSKAYPQQVSNPLNLQSPYDSLAYSSTKESVAVGKAHVPDSHLHPILSDFPFAYL